MSIEMPQYGESGLAGWESPLQIILPDRSLPYQAAIWHFWGVFRRRLDPTPLSV